MPATPTAPPRQRLALVLIVLAQWLGTSLWFSPSGAAAGLMARWQLDTAGFGWLIAATQLGFISGTLVFAVTALADRLRASRIFAASSLLGALANAAVALPGLGFESAWALRFAVGLCLAGIYPLGMKMVVQWVGGKPASALAWLVGMLVLGTAMPHGLRASDASWPWEAVVLGSSVLATVGAALVFALGDGPFAPTAKAAAPTGGVQAVRQTFAVPAFRASAFSYFGHMWELYAFWAVLPWLCAPLAQAWAGRFGLGSGTWVALLSFAVIAMGTLGCICGGLASRRWGSAPVAAAALAGSGLMCLVYPLLPGQAVGLQLAALLFWGFCVVADSPQLSALSAGYAPPQWLGSALTAQNGIGFGISVISILLLSHALARWGSPALWLLAPGPLLGLAALRPLLRATARAGPAAPATPPTAHAGTGSDPSGPAR